MSLLAGPVAFIDDELARPTTQAFQLLNEIRATGRPVMATESLPEDAAAQEAWIEHWQGLAFVVVDWDLEPGLPETGSLGLSGGSVLSDFNRQHLFNFISLVMERVYCPIFIVSGEDVVDINRQVRENDALAPEGKLDSRIAVFPKDVVVDKLNDHALDWVRKSASLSALDAWSLALERAKNNLLLDLNSAEPDWPIYIWQAALKDGDGKGGGVDPSHELTAAITANLVNRIDPIEFDEDAMGAVLGSTTAEAKIRVSEGRTVVPANRLSPRMVRPGDIFQLDEANEDEIWLNVSPACHTVGRVKKLPDGTEVQEPITLHLLRGRRLERPTSGTKFDSLSKAKTNSIVVHTVVAGDPFEFAFGDARIADWDRIKNQRLARILPPFVTRIQQMHAAYIQSEGLPRVTKALYNL